MMLDEEQKVYVVDNEIFHCGTAVGIHFIRGKWKAIILWYLRKEKRRFSEIKRLIPDITDKMLSIQLRALEDDGLVVRQQHGKKPPFKVEYSLSKVGRGLLPIIELITEWGIAYAEKNGKLIEVA